MTSQGDSRGRSRTKMVSQSQRKYYPPSLYLDTQPKLTCFRCVWNNVSLCHNPIYGIWNGWTVGNLLQFLVLFAPWSLIICCFHGDNKLHVNVFVPSGSDESDCTPGTLICMSEWVCLSLCHSGNFWPTCYRCHSNHSVLCKREAWVFVLQHAVSHHWIWFGGQFVVATVADLWLSFILSFKFL